MSNSKISEIGVDAVHLLGCWSTFEATLTTEDVFETKSSNSVTVKASSVYHVMKRAIHLNPKEPLSGIFKRFLLSRRGNQVAVGKTCSRLRDSPHTWRSCVARPTKAME